MTREAPASLYPLIFAMVVLWSANYIVGKIALREFPPMVACGVRVGLATLFLAPVYVRKRWQNLWVNREWKTLLSLGIFGVTLNQVFFMAGLSRTSASHSVLMMSMSPMFVLLIATARRQERMTPLKLTGMLLAIGGVAILNAMPSSGPPEARATLWGDFLVLLSALAFAAFTVMGKTAAARHDSITANTFSYLGATVAVAPLALWEARGFSFHVVSSAAWTSILYMALFPSVVCYLIYYYALHFIPASRVAAFSYLQPVIATIMAVIALGERVTLPLVAGGAVIFSGVYLTERG